MKTILTASLIAMALAAPAAAETRLASLNELGAAMPHGSGRFGQRALGRLALGGGTACEVHYGLAWKLARHAHLDLTLGWSWMSDGPHAGHAPVLGLWHESEAGRWRFRLEQLVARNGGLHHEGFYAVDWAFVGLHAVNRGRDIGAGFQVGSGLGLHPFRMELRLTGGVTDGMADGTGTFALALDFR